MMKAAAQVELGESALQTLLFEPGTAQKFEVWRETAGGKRVLQIAYALTARYGNRFKARGRRVSMKLIWELLRDNIVFIRARLKAQGAALEKLDGFALNNNFHAFVARHIMAHRQDWNGLFELRELGAARKNRTVTVLKIETRNRGPENKNRRPESRAMKPETLDLNRL